MTRRKYTWLLLAMVAIVFSIISSCGGGGSTTTTSHVTTTAPVTTTKTTPPSSDKPVYGGTINLCITTEPARGDFMDLGKKPYIQLSFNRIWDGDWTKGNAGGYGTNEADWGNFSTNIMEFKAPQIGESWRFDIDSEKQEVTTVVTIRQGIHYYRVDTEAGRLVNGRELTVDDVVWCENQFLTNPNSFNLQMFPYIKEFEAVKTGPWEFSITLPFYDHIGGIMRLFDNMVIYPPELQKKYGEGIGDKGWSEWKNLVGTGPFIVDDVVPSSVSTCVRNPDYWQTDPIGPGKGNKLPYVDKVKVLVLPDLSTRLSALRTGKIDQLLALTEEDKDESLANAKGLKASVAGWGGTGAIGFKADESKPYSDVKIRRAMMMSIDYDALNNDLYYGKAELVSWPYPKQKGYENLYLGLNDPDCPADVKELWSYNPDKAKTLMTEAGYPEGFSFTLTCQQTEVDYFSIIKEYFSKINVDMSLKIIEPGVLWPILGAREYQAIALRVSPPATYPEQFMFEGSSPINHSMINDPIANEVAQKTRLLAVSDYQGALKESREMFKHLLAQAYVIEAPNYPVYCAYWPWLRGYSGEQTVGYMNGFFWSQWIWLDETMKKEMGH